MSTTRSGQLLIVLKRLNDLANKRLSLGPRLRIDDEELLELVEDEDARRRKHLGVARVLMLGEEVSKRHAADAGTIEF